MANDIAVVIEHLEGKVADISFEMLGKGRELAKASGGQLLALLLGHGVKGLAAGLRRAGGGPAVTQLPGANLPPAAAVEGPPTILSTRAASSPAEAGKAAGNPRVE